MDKNSGNEIEHRDDLSLQSLSFAGTKRQNDDLILKPTVKLNDGS